MALGRVVVIGADKKKCPSFVEKVAARLGARTVVPKSDLGSEEKRLMVGKLSSRTRNDHEQDALASALFSYSEMKPLIDKIHRRLVKAGALEQTYGVSKLVLIDSNMSVSRALEMLNEPEPEPIPLIQKKPLRQISKPLTEEQAHRLKKENILLRKQNLKLKEQLTSVKRKYATVRAAARSVLDEKTAKKRLVVKERNIASLKRTLKAREKSLRSVKQKLQKREKALADVNQMLVLKCLKDFSKAEWLKKKELLRLHKKDVVLVENPNTANNEVIAEIARNCEHLVFLTPPKSVRAALKKAGFVLLDGRKLRLRQSGPFALVSRISLEELRMKSVKLDRIVGDYRRRKE